jgi:hypothetical protein
LCDPIHNRESEANWRRAPQRTVGDLPRLLRDPNHRQDVWSSRLRPRAGRRSRRWPLEPAARTTHRAFARIREIRVGRHQSVAYRRRARLYASQRK